MSDADRELVELRREVVEARNQAIKTDNQVKNLCLDIKSFEKRFDVLERRTRLAGLGAQIIVAVTIVVAAYMVQAVRVHAAVADASSATAAAQVAKDAAEQSIASARTRLTSVEQERSRHDRAAATAAKLLEHLDNRREKEAIDLLESLELASLTPLEAKLLDKRLGDLRTRAAEAAYRAGRAAQAANRPDTAVAELKKCLSVEPDGRFAPITRYLLAQQLWQLKRYDAAEPLFREILKKDTDKSVLEEVRSLLGSTLLGLGKRDEAKTVFTEIVQKGGRYVGFAKEMLAGIDSAAQPETRTQRTSTVPAKKAEGGASTNGTPPAAAQPAGQPAAQPAQGGSANAPTAAAPSAP